MVTQLAAESGPVAGYGKGPRKENTHTDKAASTTGRGYCSALQISMRRDHPGKSALQRNEVISSGLLPKVLTLSVGLSQIERSKVNSFLSSAKIIDFVTSKSELPPSRSKV